MPGCAGYAGFAGSPHWGGLLGCRGNTVPTCQQPESWRGMGHDKHMTMLNVSVPFCSVLVWSGLVFSSYRLCSHGCGALTHNQAEVEGRKWRRPRPHSQRRHDWGHHHHSYYDNDVGWSEEQQQQQQNQQKQQPQQPHQHTERNKCVT